MRSDSGTYFSATGRDEPEKIKYFIKNAIENWGTVNILLVGGSSTVPIRETHVFISNDDAEIFASDLYYADIYNKTGSFSSWDTNENDVFGEYHWGGQTDTIDLYPDVFLTRLPSTTPSQVTACVNKIISYENAPGYLQSWFSNLVVVGGDSFEDDDKINEGEYSNQMLLDLMTGFIPNQVWVTNEKLTSASPSGIANIKSESSKMGAALLPLMGMETQTSGLHTPMIAITSRVPTPKGHITSSDISTLNNGDMLPIVTVTACSTAKFNKDTNCFNWAFLANPNGGAIGAFGATGLGYGYVGSWVVNGLIGKIGQDTYKAYKVDQATTLGEMWAGGLNRYIKSRMDEGDYKTVEEWHVFGDPTLVIGEKSQPPVKPTTPAGSASGRVDTEYTYTTSTTDPEGDKIYYMFEWGDGTFSGWLGPIKSGESASATKTWDTKGTYEVKVIAKDTHGSTSVWSDPLPISMPYSFNRQIPHFLDLLFQRFPHAFPLLRQLIEH